MRSISCAASLIFVGLLVLLQNQCPAQKVSPGARSLKKGAPAKVVPVTPGGAQPTPKPGETKKPDDKKKDGEKKKDDKAEEKSAPVVTRPAKPESAPGPEHLKLVAVGKDEVRFNFRGAPWLTVLQQLSAVSNKNLDWVELPGDYLNLITRRSYKLDEARDLINRHLLARGYTMILDGEMLSVISLKNLQKLNPAMVPEVKPEELETRMPHEYVRTSFTVDTLVAKQLEGQLKPLISPEHGRISAVESVNRLEAMDTVANLRQIYRLLKVETKDPTQKTGMRQFQLRFTRAEETIIVLQDLLGIQRQAATSSSANPQMMQQMQQMMRQMQQAAKNNKGGAAAGGGQEEIRLVVNSRRNSILATAPPNKMAVIEQAIQAIDVAGDPADSMFHNIDRMKTYWLSGVDPETFVKIIEQTGGLEIGTKLEVDKKNKAVVAWASLSDHLMIQKLKEKLDGGGRSFHVIPLRHYEADYVAGTIKVMMGGEDDKKDSGRSRYRYYSYYNRSSEDEQKPDKFRVEGDVENNRLLLWCNDVEKREVEGLLEKLGEIRVRGSNPNRMRVLETVSPEDADELLRRLQRIWPNLRPNQLILPKIEEKPQPQEPAKEAHDKQPQPKTAGDAPKRPQVKLAYFQDSARAESLPESPAGQSAPKSHLAERKPNEVPSRPVPPVTISRSPDGRLIISCQDPAALDLLEEVVADIAPQPKPYKIFYLKHVLASSVVLNLEEFFEEDEKDENVRRPYWYYWDYGYEDNKDDTRRLSKRKPLRFIWDIDTNSIMVRGGDPSQWKTVEALIKLYDVPEPESARRVRKFQHFKLKYASAETAATVIKDVFRDLLSANDKALADQQKKETNIRYAEYWGRDDENGQVTQNRFKGALSIGIDKSSNTLFVSGSENIIKTVEYMLKQLEEAAQPVQANTHVVKLPAGMDAQSIQKNLSKLLNPRAPGEQQQQQKAKQNQQQQPQNQKSAQAEYLLN